MYPHNPPVSAQEFDYHTKDHLDAMYQWSQSMEKLSTWLASQGAKAATSTLNKWRIRHGIPVFQSGYRQRDEPIENIPASDTTREAAEGLLRYLQERSVPEAPPPKTRADKEYGLSIIGGDLHYPHHHTAAWELFLATIEKEQPDEVVLNGDTFDFSQLGRYPRNPNAFTPLQQDIDGCREMLASVNSVAGEANKRVILGNHEYDRWINYLWTRVPDLASLRCLDLEQVLGLTEMGWIWQPDGFWLTDEFIVDHGERHTNTLGGGSAQSARKEMLDVGKNGLSGHSHHGGLFFRKDAQGYRVWGEGFCLCDEMKMRKAGVMKRKRGPKENDWHLGFSMVYYESGGSAFRIVPMPVLKDSKGTFLILDGGEEIRV